ncbi:MAG: tyrosine-type recombinase/integrase [Betaproteobacteria bacterium]|jgi:integrase|uniref:Tyrosine-type recombinase/integrase n=1 Tax=Candidatus Dechloromonas phosphorivorans TaxID=2899244 RepID=A0A9D7LPL2_9RHOO|nr:tyrosine-type recombinase/integrase [Betaproteobacteria bacterium]MBK8890844.1 tyrosine-type recombinase/integrase [Candidatus Dechloromonas phosphorivorans]MBK9783202.1 tyrosine-type recombinase/integrase [Candidatus Dechloromonas phosphorivorans]
MGALNDIQIRHWIKAAAPVAKSDGDGLTFTLSAAGTASWVLRYRYGGKQREKTIGKFPDISLKKARELASADRVRIQQGMDVGREKQIEKHEQIKAMTVKSLVADYEEKVLPGLAASTGVSRRQKIRTYIFPAIGHLTARDVSGADLVDLLERVNAKHPKQVKEVLSVVKTIFDHAQSKKIIDINPAVGISHKAISGVAGRAGSTRIMLNDDEIKALLTALGKANRTVEFVTRILLSTAVRIQALMLAEWAHVDFEKKTWLIPPGDGRKSIREFVVPLTEQVIGYFQELKKIAGRSDYVVPVIKKRKEGDYPMQPGSVNHALERVCADLGDKIRAFSPHDLRSTARSHLGALGVPVAIAERCLNHTLGGLIAVYDQHDYLVERRKALEQWSTKLDILEKIHNNVVMLNQVA